MNDETGKSTGRWQVQVNASAREITRGSLGRFIAFRVQFQNNKLVRSGRASPDVPHGLYVVLSATIRTVTNQMRHQPARPVNLNRLFRLLQQNVLFGPARFRSASDVNFVINFSGSNVIHGHRATHAILWSLVFGLSLSLPFRYYFSDREKFLLRGEIDQR